ncbi:MAG: Rep catalytic domain protein [Cressdnaviricota sp.]|nr:MAG: Rep catalytic domain protein [Cressdnaviricota sp.]
MESTQKKFNLQSKGFFLTYPQCPAPRNVLKEMLESKGSIDKGIIGQEKHADGNLHLHAYVKYKTQVHTRNCKYFDIEYEDKTYHGKYEPAKSAIASIKYVTKHDTEPLELGDMDHEQETKAKDCKKKILGKRLAQGEQLCKIIEAGDYDWILNYN